MKSLFLALSAAFISGESKAIMINSLLRRLGLQGDGLQLEEPAMPATREEPAIHFSFARPRDPAADAIASLLSRAGRRVRIAVAYMTRPGYVCLEESIITAMSHPESEILCGVGVPTNLDLLCELAEKWPGRVHIHLGHASPREAGMPRMFPPSMHAKVFASFGVHDAEAWVGSHNITAYALSAINVEAAVRAHGSATHAFFLEIGRFLDAVVAEPAAEVFDPSRLPYYKAIQGRSGSAGPLVRLDKVLVVHVVGDAGSLEPSSTLHLRLPSSAILKSLGVEMSVHLFVHEDSETMRNLAERGESVFAGTITGLNNGGGGAAASFGEATHEVSIAADGLPRISEIRGGSMAEKADDSVVVQLRLDEEVGRWHYDLAGKGSMVGKACVSEGKPDMTWTIPDRAGGGLTGASHGSDGRSHAVLWGEVVRPLKTKSFQPTGPFDDGVYEPSADWLGEFGVSASSNIVRTHIEQPPGRYPWKRYIYVSPRRLRL